MSIKKYPALLCLRLSASIKLNDEVKTHFEYENPLLNGSSLDSKESSWSSVDVFMRRGILEKIKLASLGTYFIRSVNCSIPLWNLEISFKIKFMKSYLESIFNFIIPYPIIRIYEKKAYTVMKKLYNSLIDLSNENLQLMIKEHFFPLDIFARINKFHGPPRTFIEFYILELLKRGKNLLMEILLEIREKTLLRIVSLIEYFCKLKREGAFMLGSYDDYSNISHQKIMRFLCILEQETIPIWLRVLNLACPQIFTNTTSESNTHNESRGVMYINDRNAFYSILREILKESQKTKRGIQLCSLKKMGGEEQSFKILSL